MRKVKSKSGILIAFNNQEINSKKNNDISVTTVVVFFHRRALAEKKKDRCNREIFESKESNKDRAFRRAAKSTDSSTLAARNEQRFLRTDSMYVYCTYEARKIIRLTTDHDEKKIVLGTCCQSLKLD